MPTPSGILLVVALSLFTASPSQAETLKWSNFNWEVRDDTGGPGPNTFSKRNVRVDQDGMLHLQLVQRDGKWTCAELTSTEALGYGTYEWAIQSRVDQLDQNVVLGLFSYPTADVGPDGTNELDIEFARWGKLKNPNGNYTVWPVKEREHSSGTTFEFKLKDIESTHRYTWTEGLVAFESRDKSDGLIKSWSTPASYAKLVSHRPMPVHINLWLRKSAPPTDGKPVEIVIKEFKFRPAK